MINQLLIAVNLASLILSVLQLQDIIKRRLPFGFVLASYALIIGSSFLILYLTGAWKYVNRF